MNRILILATVAALLALGGARAHAKPVPDALQQSYELEAKGEVKKALAALESIPSSERGFYVYELRQGWLRYLNGQYSSAIEAYGRAIKRDPAAIEPRLGQMLPLMALRKWKDADALASWVLAKAPMNYLALSRRAFCQYNLGRYAEAEKLYRKVLSGWPSDAEMRAGLAWSLLKLGKSTSARAEFEHVLRLAPKHPTAKEGLDQAR